MMLIDAGFRARTAALWLAIGLVALGGCAPVGVGSATGAPMAASVGTTTAAGHLFIVGGGPRPEPMMRHFVELAGGPGRARIAVMPMASGVPEAGERLVEEMRALGAEAFNLDVTREQAMRPEAAGKLAAATGVWFAGGDQNRLADAIRGTPVDAAIAARYQAGAVIGGTSAGAAVMSRIMITGGEDRPGGARPARQGEGGFMTIEGDNVRTAEGFGLLPGAIVDQHFLRRRRHNRLISLAVEHPTEVGVGIDEATALVVEPRGVWRVVGDGHVIVYDARNARRSAGPGLLLGAADIRMHVLPPGALFDPRTGEATLPGGAR